MLQEVQVFFISHISKYSKLDNECFQNYKYLQYMGYNKNASILCSLIHYAFNKQTSRILDVLLEMINTLKNQSIYMEFANLIQQTKNTQNPVQKFFQNLYLIDQNNEIAGKILFDFCKKKDWLDGSQISYNSLANFLEMRISFRNYNEIYGIKFKESIDLIVDANKKFYYLIPQLIIMNLEQSQCAVCKSKTDVIVLICKHKQCYKCIQKKLQTESVKCCGKLNIKKYLTNQMKQLENHKEQYEKNKVLQKYYESSNQSFDQLLQQNKSIRNNVNQDNDTQKIAPTVNLVQECNLCFKKFSPQQLTYQDNQHQYCQDCMLEQKLQKDCPLQNNFIKKIDQKIDQNDLQNSLIKNNSEYREQPNINQNQKQIIQNQYIPKVTEQCQKCYKTFNYKLFEIKKCNHKICNSCFSSLDMKYESQQCLKQKCYSTFTKLEYKIYKQNLQSLQNQEALQIQRIIKEQTQQYFDCESCFNKRNEDQKYVLNCGHSVCYTCIIQNVQYKNSCCYLISLDQEYQQFRKNMTINCKGCQCSFPIKSLFQLKCKHEFCLNCCQKIYLLRPQRCMEKKCERFLIGLDDLFNFILNQKIEITNNEEQKKNSNNKEEEHNDQKVEKKDNNKIKEEIKMIENSLHQGIQNQNKKEEDKSVLLQKSVINLKENKIDEQKKEEINIKSPKQKEMITPNGQNSFLIGDLRKQEIQNSQNDSQVSETNFNEEIIIFQQIEEIKAAQELENEFCKGNCTNCNQEFSPFNRKQLINCKSHQIGVCCVLIKFNDCPQCEQIQSKKKSIKQKLILPINPVEEEFMFESTTIKSSSSNYYPSSYQQTYQSCSDQLQKLERYRNSQNSAIKRNVTTDTVNKRVQENQQVFEDKYKSRNELMYQNELTLLKSPTPYVQQSYYPTRYDRVNYGGYDHRNRLELYSRDFHLNSKITTGYSGRLF